MTVIGEWLTQLGLGQYTEVFEAEEVDFEALPHLTEAMLIEMGLRIGPRAKEKHYNCLPAYSGGTRSTTMTRATVSPSFSHQWMVPVRSQTASPAFLTTGLSTPTRCSVNWPLTI